MPRTPSQFTVIIVSRHSDQIETQCPRHPRTVCPTAFARRPFVPAGLFALFGKQPVTAGFHAHHVRHDVGIKAELRQLHIHTYILHGRPEDGRQDAALLQTLFNAKLLWALAVSEANTRAYIVLKLANYRQHSTVEGAPNKALEYAPGEGTVDVVARFCEINISTCTMGSPA